MRALLSVILVAIGVAIGGAVPQVSELMHTALASVGVPKAQLMPAAGPPLTKPSALALDNSKEPEHGKEPKAGETEERHADEAGEGHANEGSIKMQPGQIAGQDITLATVSGGTLSRHLLVPGTIMPDADRIARVPARVVGIVAEMRKRLGEEVAKGEVVAVLDSREVADAKSEYLTASVKVDLEKTNFERQQSLWDKRISAESAFLNAR